MIIYYYMVAWIKGMTDHDYYEVVCKDGVQKSEIEKGKKEFRTLLQAQGYKIENNKVYVI